MFKSRNVVVLESISDKTVYTDEPFDTGRFEKPYVAIDLFERTLAWHQISESIEP